MTLSLEMTMLPVQEYLEQIDADTIQLKGSRIGLEHIIERYNDGFSVEYIAQDFPGIGIKVLYTLIAYYLHNQAAVDAYVAMRDRAATARYQSWVETMPDISRRMRTLVVHSHVTPTPHENSLSS